MGLSRELVWVLSQSTTECLLMIAKRRLGKPPYGSIFGFCQRQKSDRYVFHARYLRTRLFLYAYLGTLC